MNNFIIKLSYETCSSIIFHSSDVDLVFKYF
jgi:hypothetical protein